MAKPRKPRISIFGPVYPFRGGISHYNSELCNHLSKYATMQVISYSRVFPAWLYPGKSQKDYSGKSFFSGKAEFIFDTLNPFTWEKTVSEIKRFKPDVFIFHWYTPYFAIPLYFLLSRLKNCRIVAICHNALPHEKRFFDKVLTKLVFKKVDLFVTHSNEDYETVKLISPNADVQKLFHPIYDLFYRKVNKSDSRKKLGLDGNLVLFFGFVRKYKGLAHLIDAMPKVVNEVSAKLLVVGEFWEKKQEYLDKIERLGLQDSVLLVDRYVSNDEVATYFSAADVVITPYVSGTQSGVINIAYAFNKPVITTDVGGLGMIVLDGRTGYIVKPGCARELSDAIVNFFRSKKGVQFAVEIRQFKKRFSWEAYVKALIGKISR